MDKNKIKSFAVWARRNLISAVTDRARHIGIFIDDKGKYNKLKAEPVQGGFKLEGVDGVFKLSYKDREVLVNRIKSYNDNKKGFEQVMEEVAYTWFNRFMGLRYMEVNEYLPIGIRVLSSMVEGKKEPDILTRVSEVIDELNLNGSYIYELLDSGTTEDREEAYKYILVKQCNELGKIIPQMFEKISDYTELLLPDNLLEEGSVIRKMVEDIEDEDWKEEVEIIGWMYQYYISEKKDEVFAALKNNVKITKENIPAATQLFTPKWIVKYMVENSLGRLWLEGHPNEELQAQWRYYLEEADQEPEVEQELKKIREEHSKLKPEDIKIIDPCMGSGHILVYAFDVLYEIYKTAGYSEREIPKLILQNNLYGLDIDDRAAQLASFALIMKARHYNRRLFREIEREHLELNLCSIQESKGISKESLDYFVGQNEKLRKDVEYLVDVFTDAKEYGSILEVERVNFEAIEKRLAEIKSYGETYIEEGFEFNDVGMEFPIEFPLQIDVFTEKIRKILLEKIPVIVKQGQLMSEKYEVCVTNPPYMGRNNVSRKLKEFIDINYNNTSDDLYSIFIEKNVSSTRKYVGMITQQTWMFVPKFEELREKIYSSKHIFSLLHLGSKAFDEIGGEVVQSVAFIIGNKYINKFKSFFQDLTKYNSSTEKEYIFTKKAGIYITTIDRFRCLPNKPMGYWLSDTILDIYNNSFRLDSLGNPCKGIGTGDNEKFLRLWYEINTNKSNLYDRTKECKWIKYNKGGLYRKWYGNNEYVINWGNNGSEIRNKNNSYVRNSQYFFRDGLTWTKVTSNKFSLRRFEEGFLFDDSGCCFYPCNVEWKYIIALLNSHIFNKVGQIGHTLTYQVGDVAKFPVILSEDKSSKINKLATECINISRLDWDSFETSWDFKIHPLLKSPYKGKQHSLSSVFRIWETESEEAFEQVKHNEEELNRIFINIYGLQDELVAEVEDKDITVRKANRERDIKSLISYAVGCILGRYSIKAEGLIYAGGEFKGKWDLENKKVRKIQKDENGSILFDTWVDATFLPDGDNIIPITEDEYFEDDIVSRFINFVRNVYGDETLEENLDFIADSIGRKPSETARQAIRRYFIKDFYKDHLKIYQKRPIYWMFESGKSDGFKALIYMHRYNEQTVAKVRTDYLHTLQRKYEAEIQRLQLIVDSEEYNAKDRTAAKKKIDRISKQLEECREYDQVVAHLANEKISIDLDDGVKVNYAKFQGAGVINSKGKEVRMDLLAKI